MKAFPLAGYRISSVYANQYDSMGRLGGMTVTAFDPDPPPPVTVATATYGTAGELLQLAYGGYTETRTYNSLLQLTRVTVPGMMDMEYRFSGSQNNGRIAQSMDWVSNQEVNYTYDALNRLALAETTAAQWGQAFAYDGFGNLTATTATKGAPPVFSTTFDPARNQPTVGPYDANGNSLSSGAVYDVENRLVSQPGVGGLAYDPQGKRVEKAGYQSREYYFYDILGRRILTYYLESPDDGWESVTGISKNVYFGGRPLQLDGKWVAVDRQGSVRANSTGERFRYYPYGGEQTTTPDNREKFGTYFRDNNSGMDYADQRYYSPGFARFTTPDPYRASGGPADPGSWNRYAYVQGDPVNFSDATGLWRLKIELLNGDGPRIGPLFTAFGAAISYAPSDMPPEMSGFDPQEYYAFRAREKKFQRDLAAASQNHAKYGDAIRAAVPKDSRFTPQMMDCMAGLESAWNPESDGPGTRTGIYNYDKLGWEGDTTTPYSVKNVQDIGLSVAAALDGLAWRYAASEERQPKRTGDQHLARAFSLFNGESKYGEYGYGQAILDCATSIDTDFEGAFRSVWNLLHP